MKSAIALFAVLAAPSAWAGSVCAAPSFAVPAIVKARGLPAL